MIAFTSFPTAAWRSTMRASAVSPQRPSIEDVERLSRGHAARRRGTGSRAVPHRLNAVERRAYELAADKGYVTLPSNLGYRRERKGSPLYNIWRMWSDSRGRPAIMLVKRASGAPYDSVWVDSSTMRGVGVQDFTDTLDKLGIAEDTNLQEFDVDMQEMGKELVPTWRIPETWRKYEFAERAEAKAMAKRIVEMLPPLNRKGTEARRQEKNGEKRYRRIMDIDELNQHSLV